ncbi:MULTISPECIES: hypothetical protein [unclassified Flavobacterium]|uniref:hypothetical protein n=1 Tax=unclassified Flavobacterium TaxID=196869 RepID=UPI0025C0E058|nr:MULTISPECIES: hypothetical protein [unclassified Flavobacterium]
MKKIFFLVLISSIHLMYGQEKVAKKPEYVIVINNEIVSMENKDMLNQCLKVYQMMKEQYYLRSLAIKLGIRNS